MPKQIEYEGQVHEFPDDFTDDDISSALGGEGMPAAGGDAGSRFAKAVPGGAVRGLLSTVDPRTYIGAAKAAYVGATQPMRAMRGIGEAAQGLYHAATDSPESAGELTGEALAGALPIGGVVSKAKLLERAAKALGYSREGRLLNITRAISAPPEAVPTLRHLESGIDLPVTTHGGLERALKQRVEVAGQDVADAESMLPVTEIPVDEITSRMESPSIPLTRTRAGRPTGAIDTSGRPIIGPDEPFDTSVSGDPSLRNAVEGRRKAITDASGLEGSLPSDVVVELKRQAQGAASRGKGYAKTLPGDEAGVSAEASMREAAALRAVLEELPGEEAAALSKANLASHTAQELYDPVSKETSRRMTRSMSTAAYDTLIGRSVLPALVGGSAGLAISPLGAVTGLSIARFLQSPVWNTFQAATKKRLLGVLERGDISAFQEEAMKAAMAEHTLDRKRNQRAAHALRMQGEGVISEN